jgi:DNA-binding NtrC family response regulator
MQSLLIVRETDRFDAFDRALEAVFHVVRCQTDNAAAHLLRQSFDTVLVDWNGTIAEQEDLISEIRRLAPHARIIVASHVTTFNTAVWCLRHGVVAYRLKPILLRDLLRDLTACTLTPALR